MRKSKTKTSSSSNAVRKRSERKQNFTTRKVSLARALSKLGYCSRQQAIRLINEGRVQVNHKVEKSPSLRIDLKNVHIQVDGNPIKNAPLLYIMFNKPRGLVTTVSDEKGRPTVYKYLSDSNLPYIFPVGRLDKASEGLLLFTNDTQWAEKILNPDTHLPKIYHVQIRGKIQQEMLALIEKGVYENGELLTVKGVKIIREGVKNTWLEIILKEGRYRHIRRMMQVLNLPVLRLIRVAIGPLVLGDLHQGEFRFLSHQEKMALQKVFSGKNKKFHYISDSNVE